MDQTHSKGKSPQQNMVVFFYENRQEQLIQQKITMSSYNKTFKQVLSFLSNLTSTLFILRIALSSHLLEIRSKFLSQQKQSSEVFCKNGVLRNFAKFTRKHLCERLIFNIKLQAEAWNFFKKETLPQVFPVNFAKFLRTPFSQNPSGCCF